MKHLLTPPVALVAIALAAASFAYVSARGPSVPSRTSRTPTREMPRREDAARGDEEARAASPRPEHVDAIVVGGGPAPEANEVEIEDSVRLAHEVLGQDTVVLFAGGADTRSVQVRDGAVDADPLVAELAELFAPRHGRDARYRPTTLPTVHGPADHDALVAQLRESLFVDDPHPLTLVLIGHGAGGETPLDSTYFYWGGGTLEAITLSDLLGAPSPDTGALSPRPIRVVVTSCFGGGLAEIAFSGADPSQGPATQDRCGLFATSWDLEAAGCDADPERGSREGYALHFFEALRGHDREGHEAEVDLNGDEVITLLEAHTRARIASRSIDVPTTTSNRLLRALAPASGPGVSVALPEEEAVFSALLEVLDEPNLAALEDRATDVEASLAESVADLETLEEQSDAAWSSLTSALLSRWPVIDDPFHPAFPETLETERAAIEAFLSASPARDALDLASQQIGALGATMEALELELALIRRALEAKETIELAQRLRAVGGADWARYERMRACENSPP